jgi:hypothetical protein
MYVTCWSINEEKVGEIDFHVVRYEGEPMQYFHFLTMARWYVADEINTDRHTIQFEDDGSVVLVRKAEHING